jgi:fumarylpyruvate hydrolase
MTGTPAGVGQIAVGDKLECEVEGVGKLTVTMAPMEKEYKPA